MGRFAAAAVLVAALALMASPVWGHDGAPPVSGVAPSLDLTPVSGPPPVSTATIAHASPETAGLWMLLLLAPAAILAACARSRRVLIVLLVVVLAVFLAEAAVHSVHHLGEGEHAHHCDFATIAGELSVVPAAVIAIDYVLTMAGGGSPTAPLVPPRRLISAPSRGRAPPALPSVQVA